MKTKKDLDTKVSSRFKDLSADKLRGGYYTSKPVSQWLSEWAIENKSMTILEPSCGDGSFISSAIETLKNLGATNAEAKNQVTGIEVNYDESRKSEALVQQLTQSKKSASIINDDFFKYFSLNQGKKFDCILGNPPFIRYQSFPSDSRDLAMEIMRSSGLKPNKLTNIWVPFVVAATELLKSKGKLAMVLPAEILQVNYAAQLRAYLTDRFESIDIIACNDLFFENAEQEVVLLLADNLLPKANDKNKCKVNLTSKPTVKDILKKNAVDTVSGSTHKDVCHDSEKWLKYFLSNKEIGFMRRLRNEDFMSTFSDHARVEVGVVTGKNTFFVVEKEIVQKYELHDFVIPLTGRANQLKGAVFSQLDWETQANEGKKTYLFTVPKEHTEKLPRKVLEYIKMGESNNYHTGYKCSIRDPWYTVPSLWVPDAFLFRQIYDFPKIVLNKAESTPTDTIHRVKCKSDSDVFCSSIYTYLTAASAEIEGRSYGGGVLELEPGEARRLLMPKILSKGISIEEINRLIRKGELDTALELNSRAILIEHVGLSTADVKMLKNIWEKMKNRRLARKMTKK